MFFLFPNIQSDVGRCQEPSWPVRGSAVLGPGHSCSQAVPLHAMDALFPLGNKDLWVHLEPKKPGHGLPVRSDPSSTPGVHMEGKGGSQALFLLWRMRMLSCQRLPVTGRSSSLPAPRAANPARAVILMCCQSSRDCDLALKGI